MNLVDNFLNNFKFNEDTNIVVGVSTGEDSMCLLHILMKLKEKINFKIIVCHINHKKRLESDEEEHFLKDYCLENKLIFEKMSINDKLSGNFESEARKIRYEFYDKIVKKYNANYLMTAHHGDDLVETILMRLTRGSTLKGYRAIPLISKRDGYQILRPLLYVTKNDIHDYVVTNNVPFRIDKTNYMDKYTRNRYRKYILPFLKNENKNVHLKFLKFNNLLEDCNNFLNKEVNVAFNNCFEDNKLNIKLFLVYDKFIQKLVIEHIFEILYKDLSLISDKNIDLVLSFINKKTGSKLNLPNDIIVIIDYEFAVFKQNKFDTFDYCLKLIDGLILTNGFKFIQYNGLDNGNDTLHLDSSLIKLPLYVRNKREGDFIELKGINGKKKVKDIFIDKKISQDVRRNYPVVVDSLDRVVWVPKLKKSKYDVQNKENCDIIFKCL